ncbi:hypothetical protein BA896_021765 [Janthinobacterium lividum]|uniref:Uncharacterized protein n=1 Tax=Janthinobacterium lividum TaxID=29581 RepID=A0A1E8PJE4_9BURK|nr:hypothetical protein BA896_021765 [Janthinobacterium lividum]
MIPILGASFALIYLLWLFFLAVMNLQRARDAGTLSRPAYLMGLPLLYIGLALDFATNMLPVSILFLELPCEMLVTARLRRHIRDGSGWRQRLAMWFCTNLLDTFDPSGCHCK